MMQWFNNLLNYPKLLLSILWLISIILVNPIGEFPLNDDWLYSYSVEQFILGTLTIYDIVPVNLIGQIFWGYLFCLPFGFSYTALRLSVLVLGWFGILGSYQLFFDATKNKKGALLGALLVGFNPVYFSLSFTFMTDIPFVTTCIWALVYYLRTLQDYQNKTSLIAAIIFTLLAVSIRQVGIFLPVAFLAYFVLHKKWVIQAIIPLLCTLAAMSGIGIVHDVIKNTRPSDQIHIVDLLMQFLAVDKMTWRLFMRSGFMLLSFGLFLLPITLITNRFSYFKTLQYNKKQLLYLVIPLVFVLAMVRVFSLFPSGNIFYNLGLGPKTLRDVMLLKANNFTTISPIIWGGIKVMALLGGLLLISNLFKIIVSFFTKEKPNIIQRFVGLSSLAYLPFILLLPMFFDRYTLPLLVLLLLSILLHFFSKDTIPSTKLYIVTWLIMAVFSICGTIDYLNWNALRHKAIEHLEQELNIEPKDIEGGYEFCQNSINQTTDSIPLYYDYLQSSGKSQLNRTLKYMVTFGSLPNYTILKKYEYQRLIPFQKEEILILKQQE